MTEESRQAGPRPEKRQRPHYGYIAVKYFIGIGLVGLAGLGAVIAGLFVPSPLSIVLFFAGGPVAFVGLWVALAYVPLYHVMLKHRSGSTFWKDTLKRADVADDSWVLDVGCGTGGVSIEVAKALPSAKVIGIDIFEGVSGSSPEQPSQNALAEGVADRVEFGHGDLLDIPFPDGTFDFVTAGSVLHEIHCDEGRKKALAEIRRVLKPGGRFITVEILRDARLVVAVLVFAPVWKPDRYWQALLADAGFASVKAEYSTRMLHLATYVCKQ